MAAEILTHINSIGRFFMVISILICILRYRSIPKSIRLLGLYLLANLAIQLIALEMWQRKENNLPLLHLNTLFEFIFFSLFFREGYIDQNLFKKYSVLLISIFSLLLVLNSLFFESLYSYNVYAKATVQVILISYVILYFFDAYGRIDFSHTMTQAISLICFAILLYYAGSLFIFMFKSNSLLTEEMKQGYRLIWLFNAILHTIFQFIVMVSISRIAFEHFNLLKTKKGVIER